MNSFWKGFTSIFNLFPSPKSYHEYGSELDHSMQDLYDKHQWGLYINPWEIHGYKSTQTTTKEFYKTIKDPARPRINKYK